MDVLGFIEVFRDPQNLCATADIAHGSLDRFLHHVAQVARQIQLAAAVDHVTFDL